MEWDGMLTMEGGVLFDWRLFLGARSQRNVQPVGYCSTCLLSGSGASGWSHVHADVKPALYRLTTYRAAVLPLPHCGAVRSCEYLASVY